MNFRRNIFFYLSVALFFICCILSYKLINLSISYTYLDQSNINNSQSIDDLQLILQSEWRGLDRKLLSNKLEKFSKDNHINAPAFDKSSEDTIWFNGTVRFNLKDDKLVSVGVPRS